MTTLGTRQNSHNIQYLSQGDNLYCIRKPNERRQVVTISNICRVCSGDGVTVDGGYGNFTSDKNFTGEVTGEGIFTGEAFLTGEIYLYASDYWGVK